MAQQIKVTMRRSLITEPKKIREVMTGLGLRRIGATRMHKDNNCIRGMINKVKHLVSYELVEK